MPTACAFAESGLNTVGVDIREHVVKSVNVGSSHLAEPGMREAVREAVASGRLRATSDLQSAVSNSKAIIIAVQTPYEEGRVMLDHLKAACEEVAASVGHGAVIVLESTVPPGTSEKIVLPLFAAVGKKEGVDFHFAYCPERIAPGNSLQEFVNNDRLIGAANAESLAKAEALMSKAIKGKLIETDLLHAETAKLVENTARDVYIAFANDLAKMGRRIGVDTREVIRLANTHPRVKILNPGPGVGGPCLTKDPYLLLAGLPNGEEDLGVTIKTARRVNDGMHLEVLDILKAGGRPPPGSKVAVLGTAYKPQVGDPRASASAPVIGDLLQAGYDVSAFDPFCAEGFGAKMAASIEEAVSGATCIIILVAHHSFASLDLEKLAARGATDPLVIDAVGVTSAKTPNRGFRLMRLGDGSRTTV